MAHELKNIRELKEEIKIDNDDLREVMICFMRRLTQIDLLYALITLETEYEKRKFNQAPDEEDRNAA